MLEQIKMPKLGESVTEGTIVKWLVAPGDKVAKYEPLAEVLTDKVAAEVPSSFSGTVTEIIVGENETVEVDGVICVIETEASSAGRSQPVQPSFQQPAAPSLSPGRRYSPVVRKLAREHDIELQNVTGTGRSGRVTKKDVMTHIEQLKRAQPKMDTPRSVMPKQAHLQAAAHSDDTIVPLTPVKKQTAAHMVKSATEIPHAWMMVEVDATALVQYRDKVKDAFMAREGRKLTYFPFFMKAVAQTLAEFPQLNAVWAGDHIRQKKDIHLSIAVAAGEDLYTPVVRHADEKSIKRIALETAELAEKTRSGTLQPEDVSGGTFTVNSTGSFGSIQSMGIINYPQAAILQVESIVKRPVIIDDMIAVRHMVNLCLTLDHRVLNGVVCGYFMKRLKERIESASEQTMPIY